MLNDIKELILRDRSAEYAYCYAKAYICSRFEVAEHFIMENPRYAYRYARDIIKGRWIEAESHISKSPVYSYYYALEVIKGRFIAAEHNMMLYDLLTTCLYARDVIQGRWIEAEFHINQNKEYAAEYAQYMEDIEKQKAIGLVGNSSS